MINENSGLHRKRLRKVIAAKARLERRSHSHQYGPALICAILLLNLIVSCSTGTQPSSQSEINQANTNAATPQEIHMATKAEIKDALKARIQKDDPKNFKEPIWDKVGFGVYYDNDDELVDIVVFETTDQLVKKEGRFMPSQVWRNLIAEVGPDNTPDDALTPMMIASQSSQPLPANNEGPITDRPRQRPTLRGAR